MAASRTNRGTNRPRTGRVRVATLLLGLVVVAGSAEAQEPPRIQITEVGGQFELLTSAELRDATRNPFVGVFDRKPDVFGRPQHDRLPLPQIDWLALAPDEETPTLAPARIPGFSLQQPTQTHPEPTHTGFKALLFETGSDFKAFPRRRSTWVILAIGGAAAAIAHPADDEVNGRLAGSDGGGRLFAPGKYIGSFYVQVGAAAGVYVIGRYILPHAEGEPRTNKVSHLGFDLLRSLIVSQALTLGIKHTVRRDRPTGDCCAFPSGHASATFATAAVLERHLGYRGAWPTFAIAAYVATSRLHDNRHFLSDVLFGGALGIASGWTVVGRHGRSNYALLPVPVKGGVMVSLTRKPPAQSRR